jgi:hypothetical protein
MPFRRLNHLKDIILSLAENDVKFIICGGVALVLHGVERMTMDLDISIDLTDDNIRKFLKTMKSLNLVPRAPVPADSLLDPAKRDLMINDKNALVFTFIDTKNPFRQVDIFLIDKLSYDFLKDDVETISVSNYEIKLVSKKGLLKMKRAIKPRRDKDVFDIHVLKRLIHEN